MVAAPHSLFVEQDIKDCLLSKVFSVDVKVFAVDVKVFSMDVKVFSMDVNCSVMCLDLLLFLFVITCEIKCH